MHRIVDSESIIRFGTSALNGKPLKVERAENVEFKEGRLLSSEGTAVVKLNGPVDSIDLSGLESNQETMLENSPDTFEPTFGSGGMTGSGKYSLHLQTCSKKSRSFYKRSAEQGSLLATSNLHAVVQRDAGKKRKKQTIITCMCIESGALNALLLTRKRKLIMKK